MNFKVIEVCFPHACFWDLSVLYFQTYSACKSAFLGFDLFN